jgi:hypothetical protein
VTNERTQDWGLRDIGEDGWPCTEPTGRQGYVTVFFIGDRYYLSVIDRALVDHFGPLFRKREDAVRLQHFRTTVTP